MSIQPIKTWYHEHIHMPGPERITLHLSHMAHDSQFWVALIAGALIAMFIILAVFAGTGRPNKLPYPSYPYIY